MGPETKIRLAGTVLQVIGMLFGILSLRDVWRFLVDRLGPQKRILGVKSGSYAITGAHARLTVWSEDHPGQPVETRINAIIKNLKRLNDEMGKYANDINQQQRDLNHIKKIMEQDNKKLLGRITLMQEAIKKEVLEKSILSITLIITGTIMSNMAPEFPLPLCYLIIAFSSAIPILAFLRFLDRWI